MANDAMVDDITNRQTDAAGDPEAEMTRLMASLDRIKEGIATEVVPLGDHFQEGVQNLKKHTAAAEESVQETMDRLAQQQYRDALRFAGAMDRAKEHFEVLEKKAREVEQEDLQPVPLEESKSPPKRHKRGAKGD